MNSEKRKKIEKIVKDSGLDISSFETMTARELRKILGNTPQNVYDSICSYMLDIRAEAKARNAKSEVDKTS